MTHAFPELVLGGVLVAPFVTYAFGAFILLLVLRPFLRTVGFERLVGNPALVLLGLYVLILAVLIALF